MPTKKELVHQWIEENKNLKAEGKQSISWDDWYVKKYGTIPDFLRGAEELPPEFEDRPPFRVNEDSEPEATRELIKYLVEKLGKAPMVSGARRRWNFLTVISKHICEAKEEDFDSLVRWIAKNCECMKVRTIKEDYVEYLALLGILEWNENSKKVKWKGEEF